jgi:hypothetical protein
MIKQYSNAAAVVVVVIVIKARDWKKEIFSSFHSFSALWPFVEGSVSRVLLLSFDFTIKKEGECNEIEWYY